jgi:hypothetical protein
MSNERRSPERLALQETLAAQFDSLARRLDDLERRNRRLKQILVAAVVLLAAVSARAQVAQGAVSGERLALVDAGRTRATLEMIGLPGASRNPVLTFLDASGRQRIRLGLGARGPLLELLDENGKTRDYFAGPGVRPATH